MITRESARRALLLADLAEDEGQWEWAAWQRLYVVQSVGEAWGVRVGKNREWPSLAFDGRGVKASWSLESGWGVESDVEDRTRLVSANEEALRFLLGLAFEGGS
jgi:hypothetical protein